MFIMTTVVSYSDFRNNLSEYLGLLNAGHQVVIKDAKKGKVIASLVTKKEKPFNWDEQIKWARNMKPIFTSEDVERIKQLRGRSKKRLAGLDW